MLNKSRSYEERDKPKYERQTKMQQPDPKTELWIYLSLKEFSKISHFPQKF
jgi:hypothetical protein